MKLRPACVAAVLLVVASSACTSTTPVDRTPSPTRAALAKILLFTRTAGFKHASIPAAAEALTNALAGETVVVATSDPVTFTDSGLAPYAAIVFLMTTGDVLNGAQQAAFERFIARGGGFAGVHSATDTEYDWPWYHELVGATFKRHPRSQRATLTVVDRSHVSTKHLPSPWSRTDEWYDFRSNPRPKVHVLVTVDESSYTGGTMGRDHPISWCRSFAGGRSWYTAMGHSAATWHEPGFVAHVASGIMSVVDRSHQCE
jgi:type 1 glutamine amidotransferase